MIGRLFGWLVVRLFGWSVVGCCNQFLGFFLQDRLAEKNKKSCYVPDLILPFQVSGCGFWLWFLVVVSGCGLVGTTIAADSFVKESPILSASFHFSGRTTDNNKTTETRKKNVHSPKVPK